MPHKHMALHGLAMLVFAAHVRGFQSGDGGILGIGNGGLRPRSESSQHWHAAQARLSRGPRDVTCARVPSQAPQLTQEAHGAAHPARGRADVWPGTTQ